MRIRDFYQHPEQFQQYMTKRLYQQVAALPLSTAKESLNITVSLGVSECRADDDTIDRALSQADKTLYQAKNQGRNRAVMANDIAPITIER